MTAAPEHTHPQPPAPGTLPVSEAFGPTWQGEGPHCGRITGFLRLGYCNLSCSWCDTPYTWDASRYHLKAECPPRTVDQILDSLAALGVRRVVLSGGEPMMWAHRPELRDLLDRGFLNHAWDCETNGTIVPPLWWPDRVELTTVSPKLAHSGDPESRRIVPAALSQWSDLAYRLGEDRVAFKFVAREPADLDQVDQLVEGFRLPPHQVWVMPEGTTLGTVIAHQDALSGAVQQRGYNLTTRLHVLLWGDQRGR